MLYIQPVTVMYCHRQTRFRSIARDSSTAIAIDVRPQLARSETERMANDHEESSTNHQAPSVGRFRKLGAKYPTQQAAHRIKNLGLAEIRIADNNTSPIIDSKYAITDHGPWSFWALAGDPYLRA